MGLSQHRHLANAGNWFRLDNGDIATIRVIEVGEPFDKQWDDGSTSKVIRLEVHIEQLTKLGQLAEVVGEDRVWDPQIAWLSDLMDLDETLTKSGDAIENYRLKVMRKDRPGKRGKYGWIEVLEYVRLDGSAGVPAPVKRAGQSAAPPATVAAPQAVPAPAAPRPPAPVPAVGALPPPAAPRPPVTDWRHQFNTASTLPAIDQVIAAAWPAVNGTPQAAEFQAYARERRAMVIGHRFGMCGDQAQLDAAWSDVSQWLAKDADLLAKAGELYSSKQVELAADSIPF